MPEQDEMNKRIDEEYFTVGDGELHEYVLIKNICQNVAKIVDGMTSIAGKDIGRELMSCLYDMYATYDVLSEDETNDARTALYETAKDMRILLATAHDAELLDDERGALVIDLLDSLRNELNK